MGAGPDTIVAESFIPGRPATLRAACTLGPPSQGAARHCHQEGLPIGNGRVGALITGDPSHDATVLADATLWTGHAHATLQSDGQFPYPASDFGTFGMPAKAYLGLPARATTAISAEVHGPGALVSMT
ncbi:glycoside hydrolase N-terminal domain-containing protein [Streptomyces sp. NPDC006458]|uniref:glycoside hydrolase N-terminal domain-containing protein n=1 Tax=Streptomyces sp. NPDC006458 TaxID=3154302 RepID=UPI0033BD2485